MKDLNQQDYVMAGSRQMPSTPSTNGMGMGMGMGGMYGGAYPQQQLPYSPYAFPPQPAGAMIPGMPLGVQQQAVPSQIPGMLPIEESYIENILRLNKGKMGTFYFTYENNNQWNAKVYKGIVEAAGRDHIILSDPQTGTRYLLLMVNFDYATFEGELNYEYPYGARPRPVPGR